MPRNNNTGRAKSTKTSHVLSLLVNDAEQPDNGSKSAASPAAAKKPVRAEEKAVASEIRSALEQELAAEAPAETPKETPKRRGRPPKSAVAAAESPKATPAPKKPKAEEPVAEAPEAAPQKKEPDVVPWRPAPFIPEELQAPRPSESPEPAPAVIPKAVSVAPEDYPKDSPICFNVMQALVESKTDKYIELFGLCRCPRCRIDVIALSLTNLPSKYVVTTQTDLIPRLAVYEGQFNAAVVSQVMHACNQVAEKPHHNRKGI